MDTITRLLDSVNFKLPGRRWELFEWCDLWFVPPFIKYACQETLTAQWTNRIPFLQQYPPALPAAEIISSLLEKLENDTNISSPSAPPSWTVIDFCSGAGGPTPFIEKHINAARSRQIKHPIPFRLSDIQPNLDAWMEHSSRSGNLSFIPQSVDATDPPLSAVSVIEDSIASNGQYASKKKRGRKRKVLRLFNLSFHHFSDPAAKAVLSSTLLTSDAFVIIELQDRNILSLILMALEPWFLILITALWFWHDWPHLIFTYALPVLPMIMSWDGLVSCLRTRTVNEIEALVDEVRRDSKLGADGDVCDLAQEWRFGSARKLHTWPGLYMSVVYGMRQK
ncbi:hypothetical protein K431DRAFT_271320 [Polychaeton citri CBS 116435]|uniref:Uncharacterized protein n=1 Tax=Polychaeton citri CBS 116435 TaxID=1314669 RepID=A0A9P4Q3S9_9PEZI|nr:hypothetical protein K431DRAFT_271320 [Polychaeton citri CBS 116435]